MSVRNICLLAALSAQEVQGLRLDRRLDSLAASVVSVPSDPQSPSQFLSPVRSGAASHFLSPSHIYPPGKFSPPALGKFSPTTALVLADLVLAKEGEDDAHTRFISHLLFSGVDEVTQETYTKLKAIGSSHPLLQGKVDADSEVDTGADNLFFILHEDPVRRYFETRFAYLYQKHHISKADQSSKWDKTLDRLESVLKETYPWTQGADWPIHRRTNIPVMQEIHWQERKDLLENVYSAGNHTIQRKLVDLWFLFVTVAAKLSWMRPVTKVTCGVGFLGFAYTMFRHNLPEYNKLGLDVYFQNRYPSHRLFANRGKKNRQPMEGVSAPGLMLEKHWLPPTEKRETKTSPEYKKPSEVSEPDVQKTDPVPDWIAHVTRSKVNPYSNGISGSMLMILRVLNDLYTKKKFSFSEELPLKEFLHVFASVMLFGSGGHTYQELLTPLTLAEFSNNPDENAFLRTGETSQEFADELHEYKLDDIVHSSENMLLARGALNETTEYIKKVYGAS